jgi:hypothetical protein
MLSLLILCISIHLSLSSGSTPHHTSEPNTTHGLGVMGPSQWGIHPMLRTCSEPQCRWATPWLEGHNIQPQDSEAPTSTPRHRFCAQVPWSYPRGRGESTLKLAAPSLNLSTLTLNSLPHHFLHCAVRDCTPRFLTPHVGRDNEECPRLFGWVSPHTLPHHLSILSPPNQQF